MTDKTHFFEISDCQQGERLDIFLASNISELSRSNIQRMIASGQVTVNDKNVKTNYKVKAHDRIIVEVAEAKIPEVRAENILLDILYEDDDIIVINKSRGMVVHPATGNYSGTLVNALLEHCDDLSGINGVARPGIVHRLDKDTSGVMVVAKSDRAHVSLAKQIKDRTASRRYLTIVHGNIKEEQGVIKAPIGRHPSDRKKMAVVFTNSKEAITINPVDHAGRFTAEGGIFKGLSVHDADVPVIKELAARGRLLGKGKVKHQYAHCWRCKQPIIYRATEQWFASVDGFREQALQAIKDVKWIPAWGQERIHNMVADRHDWCISRQRIWGVPIPIFYCTNCNEHVINDDTINHIKEIFRQEGSDAWWAKTAAELLPAGFTCAHCGHDTFRKETDIMDVWFDSGSSHAAVLKQDEKLAWPADLYLEGSDQHRGWFQSSLLTSVATKGTAPYKAVLTHGFVVDGDGRKMSKSIGNTIYPQDVINKYGADILRLWVASADYQADVRISNDILKQLSEVYRKIRNTFRYILGSVSDFNPDTDKVTYEELLEIDRWALLRLEQVRAKVTAAYEEYEFHLIYHTVHNFCTVDLSSIYLDILKDRVYTALPNSVERRAAQTAMYEILSTLVRIISPVLTFTAEEVWQHICKEEGMPESVQLADWPIAHPEYLDEQLETKWDQILAIRSEITKVLENARRNKVIGHSLDANVTVYADGDVLKQLMVVSKELANILIVSNVNIIEHVDQAPEHASRVSTMPLAVAVSQAEGAKCERCWIYSDTVGKSAQHTTLCERCAGAVEKL